jgi:glycosyltransferase involved in cell wall biosynthesis
VKLLVVMDRDARLGGAENLLWMFLRNLDRKRIEPSVVFFGDGPFPGETAAAGIRTHVIPAGRLRQVHRTAANIGRLTALLRRERPDVVLNWLTRSQLHGGVAALLAGARARSTWWQWDFPDGRIADRVAGFLPGREVAACSEAVARAEAALWPHRRTVVILPGIEPRPAAAEEEVARRRRELELPPDRPVVGIVGRLMRWKGQHNFLGALARLRAEGRDVHGLVVGGSAHGMEPGYAPYLKRLAGELGIDDAVTFTGQVPDGASWFPLMDVAVNASTREPFGIVVLEAMAARTPVVAVDAGGPAEVIDPGRTGVLAASDAPADLAASIGGLLDDPGRRAAIARDAPGVVAERFSAQRMTGDIEEWLRRVAQGASARS